MKKILAVISAMALALVMLSAPALATGGKDIEAPVTPEVPNESPRPTPKKPGRVEAGIIEHEWEHFDMTPGPRRSMQCVGDALVIKVYDTEGNSSTSTINGHRDCAPAAGTVVNEEGM